MGVDFGLSKNETKRIIACNSSAGRYFTKDKIYSLKKTDALQIDHPLNSFVLKLRGGGFYAKIYKMKEVMVYLARGRLVLGGTPVFVAWVALIATATLFSCAEDGATLAVEKIDIQKTTITDERYDVSLEGSTVLVKYKQAIPPVNTGVRIKSLDENGLLIFDDLPLFNRYWNDRLYVLENGQVATGEGLQCNLTTDATEREDRLTYLAYILKNIDCAWVSERNLPGDTSPKTIFNFTQVFFKNPQQVQQFYRDLNDEQIRSDDIETILEKYPYTRLSLKLVREEEE